MKTSAVDSFDCLLEELIGAKLVCVCVCAWVFVCQSCDHALQSWHHSTLALGLDLTAMHLNVKLALLIPFWVELQNHLTQVFGIPWRPEVLGVVDK